MEWILKQLAAYFSKNAGLNTVSAGAVSPLLMLIIAGLQSGGVDQVVTMLQNYGQAGATAAGVMVAARTFVYYLKANSLWPFNGGK